MTVRYSLAIDGSFSRILNSVQKRKRISKANAIRNAVVVLDLLEQETHLNNKRVAIVNERNEVEKIIVLPQ